jgi:hypothetical protein
MGVEMFTIMLPGFWRRFIEPARHNKQGPKGHIGGFQLRLLSMCMRKEELWATLLSTGLVV